MRATAPILSLIIIIGAVATALSTSPSSATDAASKDAAKIAAGAHQPQPVPDARRHGPTPVGRCVNNPALLHRCTVAYNRCAAAQPNCTTYFNRCCGSWPQPWPPQ